MSRRYFSSLVKTFLVFFRQNGYWFFLLEEMSHFLYESMGSNKVGGEMGHTVYQSMVFNKVGEETGHTVYDSMVFNKVGEEMGHMFSMRAQCPTR